MISILIRNPKFCFLEFKLNIQLLMIYRNSRKKKKEKRVLIIVPITKYGFLGQYL